jgi:hypothetical protein
MFRLPDGQLVLSATDLTSFLACEHLIEQKRAVSLAERTRWRKTTDPHGDLARTRGMQHELEQEELLAERLGGHVNLQPAETQFTRAWLPRGRWRPCGRASR